MFSCVSLVVVSAGAGMRLDCRWQVVKTSDGSEADGSESRVGVNVQSTPCMEGQRGQGGRSRQWLTKSRRMKSASQSGLGAGARGLDDASGPLDEGHASRSRWRGFWFRPQHRGRVSRFRVTKPAETMRRSEDRWWDREACIEAKQSHEGAKSIRCSEVVVGPKCSWATCITSCSCRGNWVLYNKRWRVAAMGPSNLVPLLTKT
jgi:hypothetical protein